MKEGKAHRGMLRGWVRVRMKQLREWFLDDKQDRNEIGLGATLGIKNTETELGKVG